jgi:F-type H+-transporting ATPase subunit b
LPGRPSAGRHARSAERRSGEVPDQLFWVIVSAANFIVFFLIVRSLAFSGLIKTLDDRRSRIEQGLQDAEQARRDRESGEQERLAALTEARREANEIINRAQKAAAESARRTSRPPVRSWPG